MYSVNRTLDSVGAMSVDGLQPVVALEGYVID